MTIALELEGCKSLSWLLSGLVQDAFHGHRGITEELLRSQLYPEVLAEEAEEFWPFLAKMREILKSITSADMDFNQWFFLGSALLMQGEGDSSILAAWP
uniref:COMMD1 N-terminal domain-containing protein n=1 Tax=Urocitellus parryii TaxID=9999 RepID=A0A8D2IKW2_UROPR